MGAKVNHELKAVVTEETQLMPGAAFHNNHWYERICPRDIGNNCIAKVKQCISYLYGKPYGPLTRREVFGRHCSNGLTVVYGLSIISGITYIACTPPKYVSDPQNMPKYVSIPMAIILYAAGSLSVKVGIVRIYKTCIAPRVGQSQLES